jgi:hypothetical protein
MPSIYNVHLMTECSQVAVTTVLQNTPSMRPIMLRSYTDTKGLPPPTNPHNWMISEAALATSAAPSYFAPETIEGHIFADAGGGGFNNPIAAAIAEAGWIEGWSGSKSFSAILSVGTGLSSYVTGDAGPPVVILPEAGGPM